MLLQLVEVGKWSLEGDEMLQTGKGGVRETRVVTESTRGNFG